jgi:hypothetical protein
VHIPGCSKGIERFTPRLEATRIETAIDWVTTAIITLLYVFVFFSFFYPFSPTFIGLSRQSLY